MKKRNVSMKILGTSKINKEFPAWLEANKKTQPDDGRSRNEYDLGWYKRR